MIVPRFDEVDGERRLVRSQGGAIESNAGARILRRQTDRDSAADSVRRHGTDRVRDERLPVAHADVYRQPQIACQQFTLPQSQLGQRRASDQSVAMLTSSTTCGGKRPSAGNLPQKLRNLIHAVRAAVSKQQHRGFFMVSHDRSVSAPPKFPAPSAPAQSGPAP